MHLMGFGGKSSLSAFNGPFQKQNKAGIIMKYLNESQSEDILKITWNDNYIRLTIQQYNSH